jgi:hypothetical protein
MSHHKIMDKQLLEMIAYCGLFCGDCLRYGSKITNDARALLIELERSKFHYYAEVKMKFDNVFENYHVFIDVLKSSVKITSKL